MVLPVIWEIRAIPIRLKINNTRRDRARRSEVGGRCNIPRL